MISGKEIVVIYNESYVDYSFAFTHCGHRHVQSLNPDNAVLLLKAKAQFMTTSAPKLSRRPIGEPINEIDLSEFRIALNTHDHLASYA